MKFFPESLVIMNVSFLYELNFEKKRCDFSIWRQSVEFSSSWQVVAFPYFFYVTSKLTNRGSLCSYVNFLSPSHPSKPGVLHLGGPVVPSGRHLLRLHLHHHHRTRRLHPGRQFEPPRISRRLQNRRRSLPSTWARSHQSHPHNFLRHSSSKHFI